MNPLLAELIALLKLERIEENLFRGPSQDLGWGQVFGGQVVGQALSAAEQTVPDCAPDNGKKVVLRKTAMIRYPVPGDLISRGSSPIKAREQRWIMR